MQATSKRSWLKWIALSVGALCLLAVAGCFVLSKPRPTGTEGETAEALARKMLSAVNHDAWLSTGAVRWTFAGKHDHLWDRERDFARVRWGEYEVYVDLNTKTGVALRNGQRLPPGKSQKLVTSAWKRWVNDSFWLNPVSKCYDPGTTRGLVTTKSGRAALLVTYSKGGVTPGDAYLWYLDENGLPKQWRMWVSLLPIGGVKASWEAWQTLATGARVATMHRTPLFDLKLTDVAGATSLPELEPGRDPFDILIGAVR